MSFPPKIQAYQNVNVKKKKIELNKVLNAIIITKFFLTPGVSRYFFFPCCHPPTDYVTSYIRNQNMLLKDIPKAC